MGNPADWEATLLSNPSVYLGNIQNPSLMAFFMDGGGKRILEGVYRAYSAPDNFVPETLFPHNGEFHVVFIDGHVASVSAQYALESLSRNSDRTKPFWGTRK